MATEQEKAALTKSRGAAATGISDQEKKRKFISDSGKMDKDFEGSSKGLMDELSRQYREGNEKAAADVLPKMHKGGVVKKDGAHNLKKGEVVLTEKDAKKKGVQDGMSDEKESVKDKKAEGEDKKPKKKHKFSRTEVEHHSNGSHTVRHHFQPMAAKDGMAQPQQDPVSYSAPDDAALHAGLTENLGGEAPAAAGQQAA